MGVIRRQQWEWQARVRELLLSEYPYTVTEGQWECCPGSWSDGECVGGGGGPFRFRQMGGSCLTMLEPTCCSSPMPCCDDVEDTEGRLEPRMLFRLELSRYGTLLLVIGIPPPCEWIPSQINLNELDYSRLVLFATPNVQRALMLDR